MNTEKELLLALLIEKYTKNVTPVAIEKPKKVRYVEAKRRTSTRHNWTAIEKQMLVKYREEYGYSWQKIANMMNLKVSQVESMHYFLTHQKSKAAI
jgi:transcriptional regulator with GAF, ATPase, and Fis domain